MNEFIQTANPIVRLLVLPTVTVLLATFIWNIFFRPPSIKISDIKWDDWAEDRRFFIEVKNTGRTAAQNCRAELFVVIDTNAKEEDYYDMELERFHIPIGWLSIMQNTTLKPDKEELINSITISGKSSERIYFGFASAETAGHSFPPSIGDQEGPELLKLNITDASDPYYQEFITRFQNKEKFFPEYHYDSDDTVREGKIGKLSWGSERIIKAEVRVTAENASTAEATINLLDSGKERIRFPPKFYLNNFRGYFRAYVSWNRTRHNLRRYTELKWAKWFR